MLQKCKKIIFSDEAHFDLGGYVDKQNYRIWSTENPQTLQSRRTQNEPLFGADFGPGHNWAIFSENAQGETVTVNGDRYRAMMNKFLFTQIEEEGIGNIWFQQDGVTCHTAEATHDVLSHVLEDRIISRRADVVCNLGAAIWNHCTMICGVPSKISGTPTSQRQLTL